MRALLLVHGFPLDARMWAAQVNDLADDHPALAMDLPGHGGDQGQPLQSVGEMADFLRRRLAAEGIDAVDLGGFSMGGYVVFEFWRRYPGMVRSLALVDTRAPADTPAGRQGRDDTRARVATDGAVVVADAMLPKMLTGAASDAMRAEVRGWMLESAPAVVMADLLAMRDRPDSVATLATIDVPTLVIVGEHDQVTSPTDAEQIRDGIRDARLEVVEGAAHLSPVERAASVTALLRDHLSTSRS